MHLEIFVNVHEKNNFTEGSKILLDTDLEIILDHQNNFVEILKNNEQCCKKFWYSSS